MSITQGIKAETVYILKEGRIAQEGIFHRDSVCFTLSLSCQAQLAQYVAGFKDIDRQFPPFLGKPRYLDVIKRKDFEDFIGKMPGLSFTITKWIGLRLRRFENRFENMIFMDVRTRIIAVFRDLSQKHGVPADSGTKIAIRLSHKDIASLVGATREAVTLELNNLKRSGIILRDGKYFILSAKHPS